MEYYEFNVLVLHIDCLNYLQEMLYVNSLDKLFHSVLLFTVCPYQITKIWKQVGDYDNQEIGLDKCG